MRRKKPSIGEQVLDGLREASAFERGEIEVPTTRVAFTAREAGAGALHTGPRPRPTALAPYCWQLAPGSGFGLSTITRWSRFATATARSAT